MTTSTDDFCHEELMEVWTRIANAVERIADAIATADESKPDNLEDEEFIAGKILEFIGKRGSAGATYRDLQQSCHAFKRSEKTLRDDVLGHLVEEQEMSEDKRFLPSGRCVTVYKLA
jgi:hypothetical protein